MSSVGDSQTVTELFDPLPAGPILRKLMQHSFALCSRSEAANDVAFGPLVRLIDPGKFIKFRDPRLNRSREIRPMPPETEFFSDFSENFRPDVASGVTSSATVD